MSRRGMGRLAAILLVAASLLAADFGLAQLGKAMVPGWALRAHRAKFRMASPVYHHDLAPSVDVVDRWGNIGYPLRTNDWGFRDAAPRTVAAQPAGRRIAVIGDSFTEGVGYPWEQTFVGQLSAALAQDGIEVLNLGVSSYSPVIYYRKTKAMLERGLRFDELMVFVDMGDVLNEASWYQLQPDDTVGELYTAEGVNLRKGGAMDWVAQNSVLGKLVVTAGDYWRLYRSRLLLSDARREGGSNREGGDPQRATVDVEDSGWTYDDKRWNSWGELGAKRSLENMDRLLAVLRPHGIRLTVAVYPWPAQVWRGERQSRQVTLYRDWCAANGIRFIDLFPTFLDAGEPRAVLERYYIPYDVHWNADGHALVARAVLDRLRSGQP